ncbi:MAG: SLATT domain-containing protein [Anaerolineales bacterium]|nr:SLATT domain-containing protein [Anaerolineales bacterium]
MADEVEVEFEPIDAQYVLNQFQNKIDYYWAASSINKKAYKRFRSWSTILGAAVTLISSLSAASFFQGDEIRVAFSIATPVIAATLTVINGLSQNFHWGAAWRDMVINATRLEKERDRFYATCADKKSFEKDLNIMNSIVLEETTHFFQRVLDSEVRPKDSNTTSG